VVDEPWRRARQGLGRHSHLQVLYWMHEARRDLVTQKPNHTGVASGTFTIRSPNRPNGLGLSLVRLLGLESGALRVGGVDAADGTPVFDVKPYLPWAEAVPDARAEWAEGPPERREAEGISLPAEFAARLGPERLALVRELLRLEVRPAYQAADERTYGMTVSGWNIRWRATANGGLAVVEVVPVRVD
jgi:tRNA-Thr(GGU) m(6)t(6)A37 methyltransferase TsaA